MSDKNFQLIETMLFNNVIENLDFHIKRVSESAGYFSFNFDQNAVTSKLLKTAAGLDSRRYKIRLLLNNKGFADITSSPIETGNDNYSIAVSKTRTDSSDIFYYHKTTRRDLYTAELNRARKNNYFEIIFMNEKDEITEGTITNLYIGEKGILYTPPLRCGLLNGTIRNNLLIQGKAEEKILLLEDVIAAEKIYISNSLIGIKEVTNTGSIKFL